MSEPPNRSYEGLFVVNTLEYAEKTSLELIGLDSEIKNYISHHKSIETKEWL
jgi:hypothetical protein